MRSKRKRGSNRRGLYAEMKEKQGRRKEKAKLKAEWLSMAERKQEWKMRN